MKKPTKQFRQDAEDEVIETKPPGQEVATLSAEEKELIRLSELNKGFARDELTIPFLKILQPLSPSVQEGNAAYIPAAKPGMFMNTANGKLNNGKEGIIAIVITHEKSFTQWVPRAVGGGLVKDWGEDEGWKSLCEPEQRDGYAPVTRDGHSIVKGRKFTIFNIDPVSGEFDPSVMIFSGTNLKAASNWSTLLNQDYIALSNGRRVMAPHYYYTYLLNTELTTNPKGSWYSARVRQNIKDGKRVIVKDMPNGKAIWDAAINFQKSMAEGTIKSSSISDSIDGNAGDSDEIPF